MLVVVCGSIVTLFDCVHHKKLNTNGWCRVRENNMELLFRVQIQTVKTQEMNLLREQQEALTVELQQRRAEQESLLAQRDDLNSQLQVTHSPYCISFIYTYFNTPLFTSTAGSIRPLFEAGLY